MKKYLILLLVFLLAGCVSTDKRDRYERVDYSEYEVYEEYERPKIFDSDELTEPSVLGQEQYEIEIDIKNPDVIGNTGVYGDLAVEISSKKYHMGAKATSTDLREFQTVLDESYLKVFKDYKEVGFTYMLSPAGSVNPLSEIDIKCMISERFSDDNGKEVCDKFFSNITNLYGQFLEEKQDEIIQ